MCSLGPYSTEINLSWHKGMNWSWRENGQYYCIAAFSKYNIVRAYQADISIAEPHFRNLPVITVLVGENTKLRKVWSWIATPPNIVKPINLRFTVYFSNPANRLLANNNTRDQNSISGKVKAAMFRFLPKMLLFWIFPNDGWEQSLMANMQDFSSLFVWI